MKKMRTVLIAAVVFIVGLGGCLAGRARAQQVLPIDAPTPYVFPSQWGAFKDVVVMDKDYVYFFEAVDGTVRRVELSNHGLDVIRILVTRRPGYTPPRATR